MLLLMLMLDFTVKIFPLLYRRSMTAEPQSQFTLSASPVSSRFPEIDEKMFAIKYELSYISR
jgi:hypothetical protein